MPELFPQIIEFKKLYGPAAAPPLNHAASPLLYAIVQFWTTILYVFRIIPFPFRTIRESTIESNPE